MSIKQLWSDVLIGQKHKTADFLVRTSGRTLRAVTVDGAPMIVTGDCRQDRVNVEIQDGIVVDVVGVG